MLGREARATNSDEDVGSFNDHGAATLRNAAIEFSVSLSQGRVVSRSFLNRDSGERFTLPVDEVALEYRDEGVDRPSDGRAEFRAHAGNRFELRFHHRDMEARVAYYLPEGKHYLRKQVSLRCKDGSRRLLRADLENWSGVRRDWKSCQTHPRRATGKFGSHPIYSETVFAGVEFIVAFNEFDGEGFILRSRPGGIPVTADWVALNPTVVGIARPGAVREAFLAYLEDVRASPARLAKAAAVRSVTAKTGARAVRGATAIVGPRRTRKEPPP